MKLKETAFCKNITTESIDPKTGKIRRSSTSDWGAELGQGSKHLMNVEGASNILNGMLYYKIDDIDSIEAALGVRNKISHNLNYYQPDLSIVLASVIDSVKVNGELLNGQKMIMFITKDERKINANGDDNLHYERRYLRFSESATYRGGALNIECSNAISEKLGCTSNGSWFVSDMSFMDESLCLTAYVVNNNEPCVFENKIARGKKFEQLKIEREMLLFKPCKYEGDLHPEILYGPPGTGKTYKMQKEYLDKFDDDNSFSVTFHQSFSYEEFIEGLKPVLEFNEESGDIKYTIASGVFKQACERAAQMAGYVNLSQCLNDNQENRKNRFEKAISEKKLVLLCIDEINRGNVAAIFGDLISLIETNKRLGAEHEMRVKLPYSKEYFGVPANLKIVGTMNTADRSIQLLDTALRRRFKFKELLPEYKVIENEQARTILENINARIRCLLNKDNQIGHAYFKDVKSPNEILSAMVDKVIPLLEEYFYNDADKIRFVLNEDGKTDYTFYIMDEDAKKAYDLYNKEGIDDDKNFYRLNEKLNEDLNEEDCTKFLNNLLTKQ